MNTTEALQTALVYEHKVRDHYATAAAASRDPAGRKLFALLAAEEQGHVEYLVYKLRELETRGVLEPGELKRLTPDPTAVGPLPTLKTTLGGVALAQEIGWLEQARDLEVETSAFYRRLIGELPAEGQRFFARFVEIEAGHVALVEAELGALRGDGHWFDLAEFDLERG